MLGTKFKYRVIKRKPLICRPFQALSSLGGGAKNHPTSSESNADAAAEPATNDSPAPAKLSGAALREAEKNLARIERALEKLSAEEAALHAEMAVHDQSDYDGLANLVNRQRDLNEKRDSLEIEWLETSELVG